MTSRPIRLRPAGSFVALAMTLGVCAATPSAQSLGELARQEEARRKAITTPGKVYTNESLRPDPAPSRPAGATPTVPSGTPAAPPSPSGVQPPAPSGGPPPPAPAPAALEPEATDAKKDEAYWRQRMQATRDALQRAQIFAEALQSRINALSADFTSRDDPAQRDVISSDRQKALAELERVRQEIEQHTKAIAAIQDEARRAGVPPGWLR